MPKIVYTLDAANDRLKLTNTKAVISARGKGSMLSLRMTLPPKPGSGRILPSQQRIPLGWPNNETGVKRAEAKARLIRDSLTNHSFDWADYLESSDRNPLIVSELVGRFEKYYRSHHELQDRTWKQSWIAYFCQLPQDKVFNQEMAIALVKSKPQNTQTRRITCMRLQQLLNFANISLDLSPYKGNYGPSKVKARELPTDEEISYWRDRIPHKGWQWIYGIMAAGGLRPHEAFFCEWSDDGLRVLKGKTGARLVHELFYPEWVEQWDLRTIVRPSLADPEKLYQTLRLGTAIGHAMSRYKVPFAPYNLRHAAAVRMTTVFQLPVTTSAALLGHDPDVHLKTYQKYISEAQVKASVQKALGRSDRPRAPIA